MGACYNYPNNTILSEETIRNIISNLKIRKCTCTELKKILNSLIKYQKNMEKDSLIDDLSKLFYEKDEMKNDFVTIHQKIFEELFDMLNNYFNPNEFLLYVYPLLNRSKAKELKEFLGILTDYQGKFYSHNKLHILFLRIFEFYSYKLTKIIHLETKDEAVKINSMLMLRHIYTYANMDKATIDLLKLLESQNLDEYRITIDEINHALKHKRVLSIDHIRDYIIEYK